MANPEAPEVWVFCEYGNCEEDHEGTIVVAAYTSKQTAEQHKDREGWGYVTRLDVLTKMRNY